MFKSVKSNKVSEHIVEQIRKAIFEGTLKPGNKLPPERELMKNFKVSKATFLLRTYSLILKKFCNPARGF